MSKDFNIVESVDEDIRKAKMILGEYSHDKDKMEKLFNHILFRYIDKIQNIADDLAVISPYSGNIEATSIYMENVQKLVKRLEMFKGNGYSNEGLFEFYLRSENIEDKIDNTESISDIIIDIGMMENITIREKEEISTKLGEIEQILAITETKSQKWERLRPYVVWISGKDYSVAIKILPLFLRFR